MTKSTLATIAIALVVGTLIFCAERQHNDQARISQVLELSIAHGFDSLGKALCQLTEKIETAEKSRAAEKIESDEKAARFAKPRFEIVFSKVVRRHTFKLDRYMGTVYLMVEDSGCTRWQKMPREHPDKVIHENEINYRIMMSDEFAADAFLINIHSGESWQVVQETNEKYLFWTKTNQD